MLLSADLCLSLILAFLYCVCFFSFVISFVVYIFSYLRKLLGKFKLLVRPYGNVEFSDDDVQMSANLPMFLSTLAYYISVAGNIIIQLYVYVALYADLVVSWLLNNVLV